jgi:hypothetical protein
VVTGGCVTGGGVSGAGVVGVGVTGGNDGDKTSWTAFQSSSAARRAIRSSCSGVSVTVGGAASSARVSRDKQIIRERNMDVSSATKSPARGPGSPFLIVPFTSKRYIATYRNRIDFRTEPTSEALMDTGESDFISTAEARRLLGMSKNDKRIYKLMKLGTIRYRRLPGLRAELLREDVERLAREHPLPDRRQSRHKPPETGEETT